MGLATDYREDKEMKTTINHVTYNTDNSEELGRWENMPDQGDLYYYSEKLMITKNGNHFLYCNGGPCSSARTPQPGGGYSGGYKIFPLLPAEVAKWPAMHVGDFIIDRE